MGGKQKGTSRHESSLVSPQCWVPVQLLCAAALPFLVVGGCVCIAGSGSPRVRKQGAEVRGTVRGNSHTHIEGSLTAVEVCCDDCGAFGVGGKHEGRVMQHSRGKFTEAPALSLFFFFSQAYGASLYLSSSPGHEGCLTPLGHKAPPLLYLSLSLLFGG